MKFGSFDLFSDLELEQNVTNTIQKFICEVYNMTGLIDVDAAELQQFFTQIWFQMLIKSSIEKM